MKLTPVLTTVFEPCEEGGFFVYISEMPHIFSQGETLEEARENLADAFSMMTACKQEKTQ